MTPRPTKEFLSKYPSIFRWMKQRKQERKRMSRMTTQEKTAIGIANAWELIRQRRAKEEENEDNFVEDGEVAPAGLASGCVDELDVEEDAEDLEEEDEENYDE